MALAVASLWLAAPARSGTADDEHLREVTSEGLQTGGLRLPDDPRLKVRAEHLFVSRSEIRVRYEVVNSSGAQLSLPVAFSMPQLSVVTETDSNPSVPDWGSTNVLDATLEVDGRAVPPQLELRAFVGGVDRTEALRARKIPLDAFSNARGVMRALGRLSPKDKRALIGLGLAWDRSTALEPPLDSDDRRRLGQRPWISPGWSLRTRLIWTQAFAAGKPVSLVLRYKPSVGLTPRADCCVGADAPNRRLYCAGPDVVAAVAHAPGADPSEAHYTARRIDYALARERGPIGDFRLVVDKQDEADLVSFCERDVRKVGPTRFEVRRRDFRPDRDLAVLFLKWNRDLIAGTGP